MDQKILNTLKEIKSALRTFATKDDLKNFATKDDLKNNSKLLREDISNDIGGVVSELIAKLDNKKADKVELEYIEERVKIIERRTAS